jgi:carbon-monoxide dehydrogenase medium subunit
MSADTLRPAPPDYARPATVGDAIALLAGTPDARPLAGGQQVVVGLGRGRPPGALLVDLAGIPELRAVEVTTGLRFGAMVTLAEAAEQAESVFPRPAALLARALTAGGDPAGRNRATVGGAVAAGRGDLPVALLALDGWLTIGSPRGRRDEPVERLYGAGRPALRRDELVLCVSVPFADPRTHGGYARLADRLSLGPVCAVAVACTVSDGLIRGPRVAIVAGDAPPVRWDAAELALASATAGADTPRPALAAVPAPPGFATTDYPRDVAPVLLERALEDALGTD